MKSIFQLLEQEFITREPAAGMSANGLYGKTGCAIAYYLLGRYLGEEQWTLKGEAMMDEAFDNIGDMDSMSFGEGLCGVGWAVEWLASNGFVDMNTDEFLVEIDDAVYKNVIIAPEDTVSVKDGTLGKAIFLAIRNKSRNTNQHRMRKVYHEMSLVILIDEVYDRLVDEEENIPAWQTDIYTPDDIRNMADTMLFLSGFLSANINGSTTEKALYKLVAFADDFLGGITRDTTSPSPELLVEALYFAYSYHLVGIRYDSRIWASKGKKYLAALLADDHVRKHVRTARAQMYYHIMKYGLKDSELLQALSETGILATFPAGSQLVMEMMIFMLLHEKEYLLEKNLAEKES